MRRYTVAGAKRRIGRLSLRLATAWQAMPPASVVEDYPAGFTRWVRSRSLKLKRGYPDHWRNIVAPAAPHPRIAVVVHVHYPELLEEVLESLAAIPVEHDVLITTTVGDLEIAAARLPQARTIRVYPVDNHGRDILPLIQLVNAGLLDPYELVAKIHTKKSAWRAEHELAGSGEDWRRGFHHELFGSTETITDILGAFAADPSLGVLTSRGNVLGSEFWGGDEEIARDLLRRIQVKLDPERLRFASGSIYWIRAFVLQGLRALDLSASDFEPEQGQVDGTTAHAIERLIGVLALEAGFDVREVGGPIPSEPGERPSPEPDSWRRFSADHAVRPRARAVAFYLPQFHTFPENDVWWGRGFTEWANVAAAQPVFPGQSQPLLPGELGFYDLASEGPRRRQVELAQLGGLHGFMYYYYWFAGTRLMSGPVEAHAEDPGANPFCLMWANENWTRRWDGSDENILIAQDYERVPADRFIHDVIHLLKSDNYIRVDGCPVVAVYRIAQIPDHRAVLDRWRASAIEAGLPGLTILTVDVGAAMQGLESDPRAEGLDGAMEFAPHNMQWTAQPILEVGVEARFSGRLMSYGAMAETAEDAVRLGVDEGRYPGVMVNFDNTARRQWNPDVWYGSNPYTFHRWLSRTADAVADRPWDQRLIFINAWNEWAESAVLEPSQRFGRTFLLAARAALIG